MKKVLIIEDDSFLVEVYATKLEERGFETEAAQNGEEGLKMLDEKDFDLVVLDISLPGIDGWQVLEKIRTNDRNKEVKVIILSNKDIDDMKKLEDLKVEKYLIKVNYTSAEVVDEIEKIVNV